MRIILIFFPFLMCFGSRVGAGIKALPENRLEIIRSTLYNGNGWNKVHAAEYLFALGKTEGIMEYLQEQEKIYGSQPRIRIGIWRTLYQYSNDNINKQKWLGKICRAYTDSLTSDRIHATETLGKLGQPVVFEYPAFTQRLAMDDNSIQAIYASWLYAMKSAAARDSVEARLVEILVNENESIVPRKVAAFVLRSLGKLSELHWQRIQASAAGRVFPAELQTTTQVSLLMAAPREIPNEKLNAVMHQALTEMEKRSYPDQVFICEMLAQKGNREHIQALDNIVTGLETSGASLEVSGTSRDMPDGSPETSGKSPETTGAQNDLRIAAAYAILSIKSKS